MASTSAWAPITGRRPDAGACCASAPRERQILPQAGGRTIPIATAQLGVAGDRYLGKWLPNSILELVIAVLERGHGDDRLSRPALHQRPKSQPARGASDSAAFG